jgi:protein KRI1
VRRADDTRKTKRQARAERKAAEKAAAEEETRRLKGKKRREMEAQIAALKKELGEDLDWTALEKVLDGEWDEAEWERVVGTILSEAAARVRAKEGVGWFIADLQEDDEKPAWDDMGDADYDDVDGEGYGDYVPGDEGEVEYEDVPFEDDDEDGPINMVRVCQGRVGQEADVQDADFVDEEEESRKKKSKKDKKDKKSREKPVEVDPSLSVAERAEKVKQTLDEYKALDHEDVVSVSVGLDRLSC